MFVVGRGGPMCGLEPCRQILIFFVMEWSDYGHSGEFWGSEITLGLLI